jgi:hypothetical protein
VATSRATPHPDPFLLMGVIVAAVGYALPWFRLGSRQWFYSGWGFVADDGGGWTLWTFAFLLLALVASLWAGANLGAAVASLAGMIGATIFAVLVMAASLADGAGGDDVADIELGLGIPVFAIGAGLAIAGGAVAIAGESAHVAVEQLRRRHFPS